MESFSTQTDAQMTGWTLLDPISVQCESSVFLRRQSLPVCKFASCSAGQQELSCTRRLVESNKSSAADTKMAEKAETAKNSSNIMELPPNDPCQKTTSAAGYIQSIVQHIRGPSMLEAEDTVGIIE